MVLLFMCGCLTARVLIVLVLYWRLPLVDDRKKILYQMRTPFRAEQIEESNQKKKHKTEANLVFIHERTRRSPSPFLTGEVHREKKVLKNIAELCSSKFFVTLAPQIGFAT